ncbi:MAG TPA: 5'-deoxynucleotidase [Ruminococcaceae bacterium]|nr:5'-deoxynucleotidase [Oscillospiraceae bacterium]
MSRSHFFAQLSRMKYISRWGLMRNTRPENLSEHSLEVAVLAHALCVIKNRRFSGNLSPERAALLGIYHDAGEILTGDMPTPVKYYNPEIKSAYKQVERMAGQHLISSLPDDLRGDFSPLIDQREEDAELIKIVKAADKLSALIKCMEEQRNGNREFDHALTSTKEILERMRMPEVDCFMREFLESFALTLDEQQNMQNF